MAESGPIEDNYSTTRSPSCVQEAPTGSRMLSGLQPSGALHLGNYFGAMRQHIDDQRKNEGYYFIADYHAMTTVTDANLLSQATRDVVLDYLALGLDPERVALYRQSDLPQVAELAWILGCVGCKGDLDRAVSYKEKVGRGIVPNIGLYTYPVLMAADILIMRAQVVPVGHDQLQHIEVARRLASRFNRIYGQILTIPQAKVNDAMTLPGIDGQKMSKSYGNVIPLFADPAGIRKLMFAVRTDSTPIENPKNPDSCAAFALLKAMADDEEATEWAGRYRQGGLRYGDVKERLVELYESSFGAARQRRDELVREPNLVEDVLTTGARRARAIARAVMAEIREAVGIPARPCP